MPLMNDMIGRAQMPAKQATPVQTPAAPQSIGGFDRQPGQTNWPGARGPMPGPAAQPGVPVMGAAVANMERDRAAAQANVGQVQNVREASAVPAMGPQIPLGYGR